MNSQLSNPDMIMPGMKIKVPTSGGNIKKEAPIGTQSSSGANINLGAKKEMPKQEHLFIKEKPKTPIEKIPVETPKEMPKAKIKETPKEKPKETPKEKPKEMPKEIPKEIPKEMPKAKIKETPKEKPVVPEIPKEQ